LAFLQRPPANVLIICFGMGTTFRSALSWHIESTAVELVPSVPALFSFFHPDAKNLDPQLAHIVIDDGRSFLERSPDQYDVIAIDPPPPVQAAGSSLLYSKEFYAAAKAHLRPGGILQQWIPDGDRATWASVARALQESFPYTRAFGSVDGCGGSRSSRPVRRSPGERIFSGAAIPRAQFSPDYETARAQSQRIFLKVLVAQEAR
jgi:spermidine synthase